MILFPNAGNCHFRDSNFQNCLGDMPSDPPRKPAPLVLGVPPAPFCRFESTGPTSRPAPGPARNITRPAILQPWHLWCT